MIRSVVALLFVMLVANTARGTERMLSFSVPTGAHPHDVAPAADGGVWYTAQFQGALGHLDPKTGKTRQIQLGSGSAPHGVITGANGNAWVTDGGLNAIVKVEPVTERVTVYPLPDSAADANLNTATFDRDGILWFTGQTGFYGRLDPHTGAMEVFRAPKGRGPYGIATAPDGNVYYASLAGSFVGKIDRATGKTKILEPPTNNQGARRVWADSKSNIWVSEWNAGQLSRYDSHTQKWKTWKLPGEGARAYAVFVDDKDMVWLSDFNANAILRFDPTSETFTAFPSPRRAAQVRQILGRPGEIWAPESGTDTLVVIETD